MAKGRLAWGGDASEATGNHDKRGGVWSPLWALRYLHNVTHICAKLVRISHKIRMHTKFTCVPASGSKCDNRANLMNIFEFALGAFVLWNHESDELH